MLSIESARVEFGGKAAVDDVSFTVPNGHIVVLLGPSGCGKSTLLRAIAGLQPLDSGRIMRDGVDIAALAPHERGIGMMFQDHALFPHRDVGRNIEFGLRMIGSPAVERAARVAEMLDLVGLPGFERRFVANLSGGEAQRVALARALAPSPAVLLLDEPLGSLDRELRDRLVDELPDLLHRVGISAIHVTHDHDEAFAMADGLLVMGEGRLLRTGQPMAVWSDPRTEVVARFLGHRNIVDTPAGKCVVLPDAATVVEPGVRESERGDHIEARVVATKFRSGNTKVEVQRVDTGEQLVFLLPGALAIGQQLTLRIDPTRVSPII